MKINKVVFIFFVMLSFCGYSQDGQQVIDSILVRNQDTTKIKKVNFSGYPYAFYTPEAQAAFGGGGIFLFYTEKDR